ncbi:hypothetical protein LCGC14_2259320 [marine sediment metagenome]|uniref:Uncharacterized protein n=1 Tax=marine sediment metagenome TaxID=412755 RepID=A0A0F9DMK1_9ZZZZ
MAVNKLVWMEIEKKDKKIRVQIPIDEIEDRIVSVYSSISNTTSTYGLLKSTIASLIKSGYFDTPRRVKDIEDKLYGVAIKFSNGSIPVTLERFVEERILSRKKEKNYYLYFREGK